MGLIVNADDFGKSSDINRAVCEAFDSGCITSTTLMANMPGAHEAYELADINGFTDKVGIHLNITEGMPLTSGIRSNPLICAPDGSFNQAFYHNTKYRLYMDEQSVEQIRDEFDAQISLFLELGFKTMHIDSHHHVHTNYPVYRALKQLSRKYGFEYIRLSRNLYKGGSLFNNTYKLIYNSSVRHLAADTSKYFGSYKDLLTYFSLDPLREGDRAKGRISGMERLFASGDVEIMVHPMYDENGVLKDTDIPMKEEQALLSVPVADKI
ncbi:MAG: ChbG/HpnK family deacetylase [Lachnospiraceae bacterium]|nr:ChbG/HpnK family deacetylase [Lachnospiraceae bacterium]